MRSYDGNSSDELDDTQLLAREQDDRDDFRRREEEEPQLETTYGLIHGSPGLVAAWERWWKTNLAARTRGILTRTLGR